MRIDVIFCPACRHKLRIAEDMLGTLVQCPECGVEFVGPPPPPGSGRPEGDPYRERLAPAGDDAAPPLSSPARVVIPAIALIMCAGANLLFNAQLVIRAVTKPAELREDMAAQMQQVAPGMQVPFDAATLVMVVSSAFALLSLMQLVGGYAMLTRRSYPLALGGAALSILNCNSICCVVGIPIGVWALIVLLMPDVRQSFH